jgi:WXG100 family type VII secretion target
LSEELQVDTDEAFQAAHTICNHAEELREELAHLVRDWDNLSRAWEGRAASAYTPVFDQWHEGATKVVDILTEMSKQLAMAAAAYEEQDTENAHSLGSTGSAMW